MSCVKQDIRWLQHARCKLASQVRHQRPDLGAIAASSLFPKAQRHPQSQSWFKPCLCPWRWGTLLQSMGWCAQCRGRAGAGQGSGDSVAVILLPALCQESSHYGACFEHLTRLKLAFLSTPCFVSLILACHKRCFSMLYYRNSACSHEAALHFESVIVCLQREARTCLSFSSKPPGKQGQPDCF